MSFFNTGDEPAGDPSQAETGSLTPVTLEGQPEHAITGYSPGSAPPLGLGHSGEQEIAVAQPGLEPIQ